MAKSIKLSKINPGAPKGFEKEATIKKTKELVTKIGEFSEKLYAEKKHNLLIVFQGMDASGKDGVTKKVMLKIPAVVIDAHSFKKPSEEEFAHDFLWRVNRYSPAKGQIKIFIRSHYEDILIQRVHNWIDDKKAKQRMKSINSYETQLSQDNNTTILKFYLHLSHERQLEKLDERLTDPTKQWKHNPADYEESKLWDQYMKCYEYAINESEIPWHIVPSDQRWYRNYFVAQIVHDTLKKLKPEYPLLPNDGKNKS
jgi:PPK2 family polyphosphate:nucleotide phosphotransferase